MPALPLNIYFQTAASHSALISNFPVGGSRQLNSFCKPGVLRRKAELQACGELGKEPCFWGTLRKSEKEFWSPRRLDARCPSFIVTCWLVWWAPHLNSGVTTTGSSCSSKSLWSWYSLHSKAGLKQDMKHFKKGISYHGRSSFASSRQKAVTCEAADVYARKTETSKVVTPWR